MWTFASKLQLAKTPTHSLLREVSRSNPPPIRLPYQPESNQKICLFGKEIGKYRLWARYISSLNKFKGLLLGKENMDLCTAIHPLL